MKLLLLATAQGPAGGGHQARRQALAEASRALGHEAVVHNGPDHPEAVAKAARAEAVDWIVIDGYGYDAAWRGALRAGLPQGVKLALVDDLAEPGTSADLIVNPSPGAPQVRDRYRADRILVGGRFSLLREAFLPPPAAREPAKGAGTILISLGTSGLADDAIKEIASRLVKTGAKVSTLGGGLRANEVRQALELADVALTAGGVTSLEAARVGLPQLIAPIAGNQRLNAEGLEGAGCAGFIGELATAGAERAAQALLSLRTDAAACQAQARCGPALIDGQGARRAVRHMTGISGQRRLRPTTGDDRAWLWHLANDPEARRWSFESAPIPWATHCSWFDRLLASDDEGGWTLEDSTGEPLGHVRFRLRGKSAVVSINIAPEFRGRGLGAVLLREGAALAAKRWGSLEIEAHIRTENAPSRGAFLKAGFLEEGPCREHEDCLTYTLAAAVAPKA